MTEGHQGGTAANKLSVGARLGYGAADFGLSLGFNLPSLFLLYYFTDVFFISSASAGLILFFAKIIDAFISPAMGYLSDHTSTRWGRKRPYLLLGALPAAFSMVLLYASPAISQETWRVAYAMGAFTLFCVLMTILSIPYTALTADLTGDSHERSVLTAYRMFFSIAGTLVGAAATMPLVSALGGGPVQGFRAVGILYAAVMAITILVTFFAVRERTVRPAKDTDAGALMRDLRAVIENRPFIILTLGVMMHQVALNTMSGVVVYFFKYNLGAENLIPIAFVVLMSGSALSIPFYLRVSRRRGKKFAYNLGMGIMASLSAPIFFFAEMSPALTIALFWLVGFGLGTVYLSPWAMVPDTVEYAQWKTGRRQEGMLYGFFFFSFKLSVAFPGLIVGTVLSLSGYTPAGPQGPEALFGIKALLTFIPFVFVIAGMVLIARFPITTELHRRMVREIHERISSRT
ncbi:MAG: MFS transporter [Spirochaetes bacterium]|jgi:GPH family glycoside/pentoside/hexuronide:cation symporter|nr:MFS transporter [Spirochaetota bacterium]